MSISGRASLSSLIVIALAASACKREGTEAKPTGEATPGASAPAGAAPGSTGPAPAPAGRAATVSIPGGTLRAGSRCQDVPRIRPEELEHQEMTLGAVEMDAHPYPNEPGKPALVGVTRDKAAALCAERGKRLCTELEWEHACKGPKGTTYPWGDGFRTDRCQPRADKRIGERPDCRSAFGVMDMFGLAMEWTASDWKRGTPSGDAVVRGARAEKVSWLSARCAHARKRNPHQGFDDVGFRCCSGPANGAEVVLQQKTAGTIEEIGAIDADFGKTLLRAMPKDHQSIPDVEVGFDKVWRWHPVANEEMLVARWQAKPKQAAPQVEIAVFKLCGERALRAAVMRGPVAKLSEPRVGTKPTKLDFDAELGTSKGAVTLGYWHGSVKLEQPEFVPKALSFEGIAPAASQPGEPRRIRVRAGGT
jgi:formylglycine-generating enzyme required for sulfatase activity